MVERMHDKLFNLSRATKEGIRDELLVLNNAPIRNEGVLVIYIGA